MHTSSCCLVIAVSTAKLQNISGVLPRRSVAATRQGDDSEGRFLMRQAQVAWRHATEAQQAAAHRIEAHNNSNKNRGQWELDLHGLHAQEVRPLDMRRMCAAPLTHMFVDWAEVKVISGRA